MHYNNGLVHDVLEAGARGYLLKSDAERQIVTAVETLLNGLETTRQIRKVSERTQVLIFTAATRAFSRATVAAPFP